MGFIALGMAVILAFYATDTADKVVINAAGIAVNVTKISKNTGDIKSLFTNSGIYDKRTLANATAIAENGTAIKANATELGKTDKWVAEVQQAGALIEKQADANKTAIKAINAGAVLYLCFTPVGGSEVCYSRTAYWHRVNAVSLYKKAEKMEATDAGKDAAQKYAKAYLCSPLPLDTEDRSVVATSVTKIAKKLVVDDYCGTAAP